MSKLSKVIAGLDACLKSTPKYCFGCPYENAEYCHDEMFTDALELLKSIPRICEECAHSECSSGEEPCRSCENPGSNWRWKYDSGSLEPGNP